MPFSNEDKALASSDTTVLRGCWLNFRRQTAGRTLLKRSVKQETLTKGMRAAGIGPGASA